jgi:hypothetical protein
VRARRMSRRLPWALLVLTFALVPAAITLNSLNLDLALPEEREDFLPLVLALCVQALVYGTTGAVVALRRPANPIGWIFCGMGVCLALVSAAYGYADYGLYGGGNVPAAVYAGWLTSWLFILPVFVAPCFVLFLFPDGRPPSPRWRTVLWFFVALAGGAVLWSALEPGELVSYPGHENPLGLSGSVVEGLNAVGEAVLAPLGFVLALAAMVVRFRHSHGVERQQLKWVAYAAVVMAICFALSFLAGTALPTWASDALFLLGFAAFGGIGVAAGVAILRYRLYDIDVVINRTLVYGSVTALLAGAYLGLVLLFQLAFRPVTEGNGLAVALSTLAVAALFRPARTRVQALVDRRFYRRKYDAQRTLEGFASRLRDEVDLDALRAELTGVVGETMQPAHVSLWLREATR